MKEAALTFRVDPSDASGMLVIMDKYGDSNTIYTGVNENLEDVIVSVFKDKIGIVTFQTNGWVRKNIYWRDGTREELYDGKWSK